MSQLPIYPRDTIRPFVCDAFTLDSGLLILQNTQERTAILAWQESIQCNGHEENILTVRLPHEQEPHQHIIMCSCDDCCRKNGLRIIQLAQKHSREFQDFLESHPSTIRERYDWAREHFPTILDHMLKQVEVDNVWLFDKNQGLTHISTRTTWIDEWPMEKFLHLTVRFHHFENQFSIIEAYPQ